MFVKKRRIVAEAEIDPQMDAPVEDVDMTDEGAGNVSVDEEATDLLFETDSVVFGIGQDEFTVTPEGDEEILEARRMPKKPAVKASTRTKTFSPSRKSVSASKKTRTVRRAAK